MVSGSITLWQINGETMETVTDFLFLGSKITADGDCSHEIKRHLLLGRKAMTNLDSILKMETLLTKVHIVKAMVFPVVMYGCESWTKKKAERWRIDAFKLQCWRRLLRVLWTARRSNQSILKEINPEYSLEGLTLKLKLQYFGQLMRRTNSLEKTWCWGRLKVGGEGDDRGWDVGWHHGLNGHRFEQALGVGDGQGSLCAAVHGVAKSQTQLSSWTELNKKKINKIGGPSKWDQAWSVPYGYRLDSHSKIRKV